MNGIKFYWLVPGAVLVFAAMLAAAADSASNPGAPEPEVVAESASNAAQPDSSADDTGQSFDDVAADEANAQSQGSLTRKARDGSGYGSGPGGERGQGKEGAPHHRQYGSPPGGVDE